MKTLNLETKKTVKLPNGNEVERTAHYKINVPDTSEEAIELLNGRLAAWATHGLLKQAQQSANNSINVGGLGDRKLMRQFNESLRTLEEIMSMTKEDALGMLLANPKFAKVKEYFDSIGSGEDIYLDFTVLANLPEPGSFEGEEADEVSEVQPVSA